MVAMLDCVILVVVLLGPGFGPFSDMRRSENSESSTYSVYQYTQVDIGHIHRSKGKTHQLFYSTILVASSFVRYSYYHRAHLHRAPIYKHPPPRPKASRPPIQLTKSPVDFLSLLDGPPGSIQPLRVRASDAGDAPGWVWTT